MQKPLQAFTETDNRYIDVDRLIVPDTSITVGSNDVNIAEAIARKQNKAWTVVASAGASVSPSAADSGKYYRLSNANPTFNLPTTGLIVGETEFWLTLTGDTTPIGVIDAGTGKTIDWNAATFAAGQATQTVSGVATFRLYHLRYVATNTWTSDLIAP